MPTYPAIHQITHQDYFYILICIYVIFISSPNAVNEYIHFLAFSKNMMHDVERKKLRDSRMLMSVQIDLHLIIWPIAIKRICEKQELRTICTYQCIAVQISFRNYFARKYVQHNTENRTGVKENILKIYSQLVHIFTCLFNVYIYCLILLSFDHHFYVSAMFVLFDCKFECSSGHGDASNLQLIRIEARKVTFGPSYQWPASCYNLCISI